ncbi:FAS1-like dehydratase domain-containing protein [Arenibaculum sp.]|uniref:FAS1-like dehydratase domain-containing protein n=1 Tax=Arenibaculum sp. TaxID=2865862 RepID=UPI002E146136|nr:MaoC family dehydratase N-terminal domain-containing protein [Arenibaculum sp.]
MERADGIDLDHLRGWLGRTERRADTIGPWAAQALAATLGWERAAPGPGEALPEGWHWACFLTAAPAGELGRDGHPRRGGFLPPVPLPRRMWAGGRLSFERPLRIGEEAERVSEVADIRLRDGRTGPLVFVTVRHTVSTGDGPALVEEHDIVYRGDRAPGEAGPQPRPAPEGAAWSRTVTPDPVLLFRYSALTFNGHRIHYDRTYATGVEGYPGLVVHGPLLATLLLDLARQHAGGTLARFEFRSVGTLFDTAPFTLAGRPGPDGRVELWAAGPDGALAMTASAELRPRPTGER